MKKYYLVILFLLIHFCVTAQFKNYFVDGARWTYTTWETQEPGMHLFHNTLEQNFIVGDSIVNGINYKKLYTNKKLTLISSFYPDVVSYDSIGPQLLRVDTSARQVYFKSDTSTDETLLYDFNKGIGDSVYSSFTTIFLDTPVIDSIETITFFGHPTKKYYYDVSAGAVIDECDYIIEGIGGSNGLTHFTPVFISLSGGLFMTSLVCFQIGDSVFTTLNGFCFGTSTSIADCDYINVLAGINDKNINRIVVYPNPAQDQLTIKTDRRIEVIEVFNILGAQQSAIRNPQSEIDVSILIPGIYFIKLYTKEGSVVKRFVKE